MTEKIIKMLEAQCLDGKELEAIEFNNHVYLKNPILVKEFGSDIAICYILFLSNTNYDCLIYDKNGKYVGSIEESNLYTFAFSLGFKLASIPR